MRQMSGSGLWQAGGRLRATLWAMGMLAAVATSSLLAPRAVAEDGDGSASLAGVSVEEVQGAAGVAKVILDLDGAVTHDTFQLAAPNRLVVDLFGATLATRPAGAAGPVSALSAQEFTDGTRTMVRVELALVEATEFDLQTAGDDLVLFVGAGAATVAQAAAASVGSSTELDRALGAQGHEAADAGAVASESFAGLDVDQRIDALLAEAPLVAQLSQRDVVITGDTTGGGRPQPNYTGAPTNFDLKDIDIVDFLQEISRTSGYNIVVDPEVTGRVTIKMEDVPWDQVLDVVLKNNGLDVEVTGNIMRVASVEKLKREEEDRLALEEAKKLAVPLETKIFYLSYARPDDLRAVLEKQLSKRGEIIVDARTNAIIIADIPDAMRKAEQLIDQLDIRTRQVVIQSQIVQTSKDFSRSLGISWGIGFNMDQAHGNTTGYRFPNVILGEGGFGSNTSDPAVGDLGAVVLPSGTNFEFGFADVLDTFRLYVALSAAEGERLIRTISNPRISTADNKQAKIESGTQIPYEVLTRDGPKTEFKNAFITLLVTPHITFDNHITLDVKVSKDRPVLLSTRQIGIDTNQAQTNVLVKDGETLVIGGLNESSGDDVENKTPWLGDIPVLGWLFKAKTIQNQFKDLLFFITPSILQEEGVAVKQTTLN